MDQGGREDLVEIKDKEELDDRSLEIIENWFDGCHFQYGIG